MAFVQQYCAILQAAFCSAILHISKEWHAIFGCAILRNIAQYCISNILQYCWNFRLWLSNCWICCIFSDSYGLPSSNIKQYCAILQLAISCTILRNIAQYCNSILLCAILRNIATCNSGHCNIAQYCNVEYCNPLPRLKPITQTAILRNIATCHIACCNIAQYCMLQYCKAAILRNIAMCNIVTHYPHRNIAQYCNV